MTDIVAPPPPAAAPSPAESSDKFAPEGRSWVVIEDHPDIPPTGLPLSVNGEAVLVMPGEPVHLANRFVEVLENAIMGAPVTDKGGKVVGYRERHRFGFRRVPAPAAA